MFVLKIDTSNDAFAIDAGAELATILRRLADDVEGLSTVATEIPIGDTNGNRCGLAVFEPPDAD